MNQTQPPPRINVETFLRHVRASGLVTPERLELAMSQIPPTERSRVVARALVDKGLLTKFQAERLLAGKTDGFLMGQYRVLDEIGRGGMGHVFKAEHMTMGRLVALKILSGSLLKTERARQMFHREVKAAAKLNHPNIVTAFDANQVGDRCFLVMEYVDGPNLYDLVKSSGPLPVTQACDYIRQAAIGLQYAHDIGMVHRDIKPANLLVQTPSSKAGAVSSVVKILDFGLARISSPEDETQEHDSIEVANRTVMGTPDYLSPEQARSLHDVDGRADIYSLGCTLYFLLAGHAPFPGGTTLEKLVRHSTDNAVPVNSIRPEVPAEVAAIVQKMMAKKAEDRYQSAAEVAVALQPHTGQESNNWVVVEPLPADNIMPVSSKSLPRLAAPLSEHDPFANLESHSHADGDEHSIGTLSNEGAMTDFPSSKRSYKNRRKTKNPNNDLVWASLGIFALLAIMLIVFLAVRPQLLKLLG